MNIDHATFYTFEHGYYRVKYFDYFNRLCTINKRKYKTESGAKKLVAKIRKSSNPIALINEIEKR